jgi:hypothetical protein
LKEIVEYQPENDAGTTAARKTLPLNVFGHPKFPLVGGQKKLSRDTYVHWGKGT